jgi:cytoskeletal protein RodZ
MVSVNLHQLKRKTMNQVTNPDTNSTYVELDNKADIEYSKPSKSRFLFLLFFLGFFIFMGGCSYALWTFKYKSTADIEVPPSTKANPTYK